MESIVLEKIKIKNFLGIQSLEILLGNGIYCICGENHSDTSKFDRNGLGKSSIIEAVYWCLKGNTIRNIKANEVIYEGANECEVVLEFGGIKKYEFTRVRRMSQVIMSCKIDGDDYAIKKTDTFCSILGIDEKYLNAIHFFCFGIDPKMKSVFDMTKSEQLSFWEMLLPSVKELNDNVKRGREYLKQLSKSQDNLQMQIDNAEREMKGIENDIVDLTDKSDNYKSEIEGKLDDLKKELKNIDRESNNLEVKLEKNNLSQWEDESNRIEEAVKELNDAMNKISMELNSELALFNEQRKTKYEILNLLDDAEKMCPLCRSELSNERIENMKIIIGKEIKECEVSYNSFKKQKSEEMAALQAKMRELEKDRERLRKKDNELLNINDSIMQCLMDRKKVAEKISDLEEQIGKNPFNSLIEKKKESLKKLDAQLTERYLMFNALNELIEIVEYYVGCYKGSRYVGSKLEEYRDKRIANLIFFLNDYIGKVASELFGEFCVIKINDISNVSKDFISIEKQGKDFSFSRFSDGEKNRLLFTMLLGVSEYLSKVCGLSSMDFRCFDEKVFNDLDNIGIERLLGIIDKTNLGKNILVSNREEVINSIEDKIYLIKDKYGSIYLKTLR